MLDRKTIWKNIRIGSLAILFIVGLLHPESVSIGGAPSIIFSTICFIFGFVMTLFMGSLSLAFKKDKRNLQLPSISSSPFDSRVIWQLGYMMRLALLVAGVSQILMGNWIDASVFLSLSAGFFFGELFLCRINRRLLNRG